MIEEIKNDIIKTRNPLKLFNKKNETIIKFKTSNLDM